MSLLSVDYSRCVGARWGNNENGEFLEPCRKCKRRLQVALDPPSTKVSFFAPPLFKNGSCPHRIEADK